MRSGRDRTLGRLVVALGLAESAQVEAALAGASDAANDRPLADRLVERGVLTREDAARLGEILRLATESVSESRPGPVTGASEAQTLTEAVFNLPTRVPSADRAEEAEERRPPGSPRDSSEPSTSLGPFDLLEEVGRGGMGVVYRARHRRLDRIVALKLLGAAVGTPEEIERFHREAQSAARLHHPGIVEIYDVGEVEGRPYIAMEFVAGQSLDRFLADRQLPLRQRVDLLRRIAEAVEQAHAHGIVHRDLKPGNVLIDPEGRPRVADFGLAKEVRDGSRSLTRSGAILGTPQYMSPEQADGDGAHMGPPSDVFSLGVMLYEILSGRRPFVADRPVALIVKILSEEIVSPRRRDPRVPVDLDTVCMKALEKDWGRRYATAGALAADLGRWLEGEPIEARPTTLAYRVWMRARRNPVVSGLAVALVVAGVTLGGLGWRAWERDREAARARAELVEGSLRELARSGEALVDAALARRALGDLAGSAAYAQGLEEPVRRLIELAPNLAEPWYHRGRLERARGGMEAAEAAQGRAVELASSSAATSGSRAVRVPALYERAILRAARYRRLQADRQQRMVRARAAGRDPDAVAGALPTVAEIEAAYPDLAELKRATVADLEEVARSAAAAVETDPIPGRVEGRAQAANGIRAAFAGGAVEEAEAALRRALAAYPYLEEVYAALAGLCIDRGAWEEAAAWYEQGRQADRGYLPHVEGLAWVLSAAARVAESAGRDGSSLHRRVLETLDAALEIAPRRAGLWDSKAQAHLVIAETRFHRGEDPESELAAALAATERTLALEPADPRAAHTQGDAWSLRAEALGDQGEDPAAAFAAAAAAYERALALEADRLETVCNLANLQTARAEWRSRHGEDPTREYADAVAGYDRALALSPRSADLEHNRAIALSGRGNWRRSRGEDPGADLSLALAGLARALAIEPGFAPAAYTQGEVERASAEWASSRGEDAAPAFARALACYGRALAINPRYLQAANARAALHWTLGNARAGRGEDPREDFDRALEGFESALAINPRFALAANNAGNVHATRAEWSLRHGEDPAADFARALAAYDRALGINPNYPTAAHNQANVHRSRAEWLRRQGEDPAPAYEQALAGYDRALRINPAMWQAHLARGLVLAAQERLDDAEAAFDHALRIFPGQPQALSLRDQVRARKAGGGK